MIKSSENKKTPWYKNYFEKWYFKLSYNQVGKPLFIKKEVIFIKKVLNLPKGSKILDLCCGHGRLLLPLAKAGYQMTGLELNKKFLAILAKNAKKENLKVGIINGDMRNIPFKSEFDAIINMFSSFGYLETDNEDFKVLKSISNALKPGGKLLIDLLNPDFYLANFTPKSWVKVGKMLILDQMSYNTKTRHAVFDFQILNGKNKWQETNFELRLYSLPEMKEKLSKVGLKIVKTYGSTISGEKFTKKSPRLVILAEKK